ncbi:MAG TPA: cyclase family protein [Actinophytocola sp.]|nr:cyclase family protein [Actinophytocola sp.]
MTAAQQGSRVGPAGDIPAAHRVQAAALVRTGRQYSLAATRFPGMPLFPGHPPFQVVSYRTPRGLRVGAENLWAPTPNEVQLGCMTEVITSTAHSGAHIDALAHITIGEDDHWYGGANATDHLGDFGPTVGDAASLPPLFTRGVLLDVAGYRGVDCLPAGSPIDAAEIEAVATAQDVQLREWDVVLVRTGYMGLWPDAERMARHTSPGPDLSAAELLADAGVVAVGSDTETFEVQPAPDPGAPSNPQPVHTRLLVERGIYLMESLYLEQLAADRVHEFLFVALPIKIAGATGSMMDPLAVV